MEASIYHIYNRGNHKEAIFFRKTDLFILRKMIYKHFPTRYFDLVSFCIMPNHYHVLVATQYQKKFANCMRDLGREYTVYMNKKYGLVGHLFQGPYKRKAVKNYVYYRVLLEYIKENPRSFKGFGEQPFLFMENRKLIEYYDILLSEQYPL